MPPNDRGSIEPQKALAAHTVDHNLPGRPQRQHIDDHMRWAVVQKAARQKHAVGLRWVVRLPQA